MRARAYIDFASAIKQVWPSASVAPLCASPGLRYRPIQWTPRDDATRQPPRAGPRCWFVGYRGEIAGGIIGTPKPTILLGTKGGPTPSRNRAPAANLLVIDGKPYVVDCPDGTSRQIVLAGVRLPTIGPIFVTHLHSDHMAGLGALLLVAWGAGLQTPVTVFGPPGLSKVVEAELAAGTPDIEYRMREEGRPDLRKLVRTIEICECRAILDGTASHSAVRMG